MFYRASIKNAVSLYYQSEGDQSRLLNGSIYHDYTNKLIGHAYFVSDEFNKGSIHYDGLAYEDVPMLYDIILDEVVILHPNNIFRISLVSEKIADFNLLDHHFVRIVQDTIPNAALKTGFYDMLYEGKLTVLKKQTKKAFEKLVVDTFKRAVSVINRLYLKKDGNYYFIPNKRTLLSVLQDKKDDIELYLRKNRIKKFRKNPDHAIVKIAAYYDEITN